MPVTIHLHTILQVNNKAKQEVNISPGSNVQDVIDQLGLYLNLAEILLVVNQRLVDPYQVLQEGDEIHIIPAISGG